MTSRRPVRWSKLALLAGGVFGLAGLTISPSYAANDTEIYIVQGLPGKNLDVAVDGESVAEDVKTASVAGPFSVKPGSRMVTFSEMAQPSSRTLSRSRKGPRPMSSRTCRLPHQAILW